MSLRSLRLLRGPLLAVSAALSMSAAGKACQQLVKHVGRGVCVFARVSRSALLSAASKACLQLSKEEARIKICVQHFKTHYTIYSGRLKH